MTILDLSTTEFLEDLASKKSTPGGGAVAAINGAQAAGLISMVLELTKTLPEHMDKAALQKTVHNSIEQFGKLAQQDVDAFNEVMAAYKTKTNLGQASEQAAGVPLDCLSACVELMPILEIAYEHGNANLITDTAIAALLLRDTILASELNVLINLRSITNDKFKTNAQHAIQAAKQHCTRLDEVSAEISKRLS